MPIRRWIVVVVIVALLALAAALGGHPKALFGAGITGAIIAIPLLLPLSFILLNVMAAALLVGMILLGPWLIGADMFTGEDLDGGPMVIGIGVIVCSLRLLWYTLEVLLTGKTDHLRLDADVAGNPPSHWDGPPFIVPIGHGTTGSSRRI